MYTLQYIYYITASYLTLVYEKETTGCIGTLLYIYILSQTNIYDNNTNIIILNLLYQYMSVFTSVIMSVFIL